MIEIRIRLTPTGHYFLGGERGFSFDQNLERQMSASYFIKSLKVPTQTTLFGALRYIIGVKEDRLRADSDDLIGHNSYDIVRNNDSFGIIKCISPLYLYKETGNTGEYFIRTPFDHKIGSRQTKDDSYERYTPLMIDSAQGCSVINYPGTVVNKKYPIDYKAKNGISKSYTSLTDGRIAEEDSIFVSSVEVVSRKNKRKLNNEDGFAKKEYIRLKKGWSFVFFATLDTDSMPEYNRSVILGKDSSLFCVEIIPEKEPNISDFFKDRPKEFHYCQSPVYVSGGIPELIDQCSMSIVENESLRRFKTKDSKLVPEYNAPLLSLLSAGSVLYSNSIEQLKNDHAETAGFNKVIEGGNE